MRWEADITFQQAHKVPSPFDQYQIILPGNRGTSVNNVLRSGPFDTYYTGLEAGTAT